MSVTIRGVSDDVKRPYRSPRRQAQAERTRAAIRAAAADLFERDGVAATTMRAIAERAGVGERTLYDAFPTKGALFDHVVGVAIVGDEAAVPVAERPGYLAALEETDARRAIELWAAFSATLLGRAGRLIAAAAGSAGADAAMRAFTDLGAEQTRANVTAFVDRLADGGGVALDRQDAIAAVLATSSPLTYVTVCDGLGWDDDRYERWLSETLTRLLLGP